MIFVTVGTHEQPFDRLIKKIDELVKIRTIKEPVFIQSGYSTYVPENYNYSRFLTYDQMNNYMQKSNIIVSHGGPSTFMKSLSLGKKTVVVPRLKKFNEHVNNHQLDFAERVSDMGYGIIVVKDIDDLDEAISKESFKNSNRKSNNNFFVNSLSKKIYELYQ